MNLISTLMNLLVLMVIVGGSVFASYKLAIEKGQHKIIWPICTLLISPSVFIIQYLATIFRDSKKIL